MADVVVVGGGVAGLVAARRIALGGLTVTLLEASERLGGTVAHHAVGGIELDAGAESFSTRRDTVANLARELGLGDDIVTPNPAPAWLQPSIGAAVQLPATNLLGIPGSPLASDVVAVLGGRAAFRAYLESLLPGTVGAQAGTLGELVRLRMGRAVLERLVAPVTYGVYSSHPDELDLDRVAPGLRAALRREGSLARAVRDIRFSAPAGALVAGIRGGLHRIVVALTADLDRLGVDVRTGVRVDSVEVGRVRSAAETFGGSVVVAAPGLFGDRVASQRRVVLATLVVDEPLLDVAPRGTGVLVAAGAHGIAARALTHATAKWPWLAERADGKHVIRLSYDTDPVGLVGTAIADASALLGVPIAPESLVDFARVEWIRPAAGITGAVIHAADGITVVGEAAAGTGLAAIVAQATAESESLLEDTVK